MTKGRLAVLILLLVMISVGAIASTMSVFGGKGEPIQQAMGVHPMDTEMYTETWGFLSVHDDGSFGFVNLGVSNAGIGDRQPTLQTTFWTSDGKVYDGVFNPPKDSLSAAKTGLDVKVRGGAFKLAGNKLTLEAKAGQVSAEWTSENLSPPWRPGSGKITFARAEDFWSWLVLTHRGRMKGTFTAGEKSFPVEGYAYVDHTWSNLAFFSFSKRWISLRIQGPELSINFVQFDGAKKFEGRQVRILSVADDSGLILSDQNIVVAGQMPEGKDLSDKTITLEAKGIKIDLKFIRLAQHVDPLAHMNFAERALIKSFVTSPGLDRYLVEHRVRLTTEKANLDFKGRSVLEQLTL